MERHAQKLDAEYAASTMMQRLQSYFLRHKFGLTLALLPSLLFGAALAIIAKVHGYAASPTVITAVLLYSLLSFFALAVGAANHLLMVSKRWNIIGFARSTMLRTVLALKIIGLVCAIQSALMVSMFMLAAKLPPRGVFLMPFAEIWLTTFIAIYAASALGIFIVTVTNSKRVALVAGVVVFLVQALFTGAPFPVKKPLLSAISYASICRWSLESYVATANFIKIATDEGLRKIRGNMQKGYEVVRPLDRAIGGAIERLKNTIQNSETAQSMFGDAVEGVADNVLEDRGLSTGPPKHRIARAWAMQAILAFCFSVSAFGTLMAKSGEGVE